MKICFEYKKEKLTRFLSGNVVLSSLDPEKIMECLRILYSTRMYKWVNGNTPDYQHIAGNACDNGNYEVAVHGQAFVNCSNITTIGYGYLYINKPRIEPEELLKELYENQF